jgi:hypothetical protein
MLEDILAYRSGTRPSDSFSALLEANLDDDAQLFFLRMAAEVSDVPGAGAALRQLLAVLTTSAPARAAAWRELYREFLLLVAANPTVPLRGLRAFLAENADLAESLAIDERERTPRRHARGPALGA